MTVKLWDLAMERKPVATINVHEHLRDRLCDTYENDAIFDKFEVQFGGDNRSVMTGSYNNNFMIYPNAVNANASGNSGKGLDMSLFSLKRVREKVMTRVRMELNTMTMMTMTMTMTLKKMLSTLLLLAKGSHNRLSLVRTSRKKSFCRRTSLLSSQRNLVRMAPHVGG